MRRPSERWPASTPELRADRPAPRAALRLLHARELGAVGTEGEERTPPGADRPRYVEDVRRVPARPRSSSVRLASTRAASQIRSARHRESCLPEGRGRRQARRAWCCHVEPEELQKRPCRPAQRAPQSKRCNGSDALAGERPEVISADVEQLSRLSGIEHRWHVLDVDHDSTSCRHSSRRLT
jgi:hypothetical protein